MNLYIYAFNSPIVKIDFYALLSSGDVINWGLSVGAVVAREGGLISAKIASRISIIGSILGELVDPPKLNAEEDILLRGYHTEEELREIGLAIRAMEKRVSSMEQTLGISPSSEEVSCEDLTSYKMFLSNLDKKWV